MSERHLCMGFFHDKKGFYILKNNKWLQTKFEKKNLEG